MVEAVCNTRLQRREIIVVDDCLQGGTTAMLHERLSQVVDRIIIIRKEPVEGIFARVNFRIEATAKSYEAHQPGGNVVLSAMTRVSLGIAGSPLVTEAVISLIDDRQKAKKPGRVAKNCAAKTPVSGIAKYL